MMFDLAEVFLAQAKQRRAEKFSIATDTRSRIKIFFPVGASLCASVPPPAPLPMMITSKWLSVVILISP